MGYTHYFDYGDYGAGWPKLVEDTRKIFEAAKENGTEIRNANADKDTEPVVDEEYGLIEFNGANSHEPLVFPRDGYTGNIMRGWNAPGKGFHFCKTARKEYDWVVCLFLLRAHKHGDVDLGSDGGFGDAGWDLAKEMHLKLWPDEVWKNPFIVDEAESAGGGSVNVDSHKDQAEGESKD